MLIPNRATQQLVRQYDATLQYVRTLSLSMHLCCDLTRSPASPAAVKRHVCVCVCVCVCLSVCLCLCVCVCVHVCGAGADPGTSPRGDLTPSPALTTAVKQCRNLTRADAPANGGLVCHWYREANSQQCGVRCNKGYEFPSRVNDYELCGPDTGYTWSFQQQDPEAVIEPCIGEWWVGQGGV